MGRCLLFHDWSDWKYHYSGKVIDWEMKICLRCGDKKYRMMEWV